MNKYIVAMTIVENLTEEIATLTLSNKENHTDVSSFLVAASGASEYHRELLKGSFDSLRLIAFYKFSLITPT